MEFLFRDKYVLRFDAEELPYLNEKLDMLFAESISGEGNSEAEWRDDMSLDTWILSIYPPTGLSMMFIKCMGEDDVTVRAINTEKNIYDTFRMDVVEAVGVLREFSAFVGPPAAMSIENGFEGE